MLTKTLRALFFCGILIASLLAWSAPWETLFAQNLTAGSPAPVIPQQFLDDEGDPLASGTVSTYVTGTSTTAVTYTDAALNTRAANPIVLDAAGRASIFLSATQVYRWVIANSANADIRTRDDIRPVGYTAEVLTQRLDCDYRISLSSGVPVTVSDVTAAGTVYMTPYRGNRCSVFDGTAWTQYTFSELSLSLGTDAANSNYDLFVYASGGVLTLERLVWTNFNTRATALTYQDGVPVRSGATTRRFLGTYRTTNTAGETEDSFANRLVWNYQHRVPRLMRMIDGTNTWTYTTATYREANATTNRLSFVIGLAESLVDAEYVAVVSNTGYTGATIPAAVQVQIAIGDGGIVPGDSGIGLAHVTQPNNVVNQARATFSQYAAVGYHTWLALERSTASGTTTWYGDNGDATLLQSGIFGWFSGD